MIICRNFVKFIKIPSKNDECHWKIVKFATFCQSCTKRIDKIHEISEFGAVQRNTNLVDIEKRFKNCAYSRYRSCPYR